MKTLVAIIIASIAIRSTNSSATDLTDIYWMCEQYPPYSWKEKNSDRGTGIAFDILVQMLDEVNAKVDPATIDFLPWARSYQILQDQKNTALISMTYTPEREALFKFVGPIIPAEVGIIAKKSRFKKNDLSVIANLVVGIIKDNIGDQLLKTMNIKTRGTQTSNSIKMLISKLVAGRVEAISYNTDVAFWTIENSGHKADEFEILYSLHKSAMGYAFHKEIDPTSLGTLQRALDKLRERGEVDRIIKKYLHR